MKDYAIVVAYHDVSKQIENITNIMSCAEADAYAQEYADEHPLVKVGVITIDDSAATWAKPQAVSP